MMGIGETVGTALLITAGVVAVAEGVNETAKLLNETVNTVYNNGRYGTRFWKQR